VNLTMVRRGQHADRQGAHRGACDARPERGALDERRARHRRRADRRRRPLHARRLRGRHAPTRNLDTLFGWTARQGSLTLAAHYRLEGDELEATNDVGADGLQVVRSPARAKPPKWPIGLPLDTFVSLLEDRYHHVELSLPVHGRLSSPQFDLGDAIWSALRGLAFKTIGLPFTAIGRLFVTEDSRIEALSVNPVRFVPGAATPAAGMTEHLDRLGVFLRDRPVIRLQLRAVLTVADVEPLKREALRERLQARGQGRQRRGAARAGAAAVHAAVPQARAAGRARRSCSRRWPPRTARPPRGGDARRARVAAVRDALVARGVDAGRLAAQTAPPAVEARAPGASSSRSRSNAPRARTISPDGRLARHPDGPGRRPDTPRADHRGRHEHPQSGARRGAWTSPPPAAAVAAAPRAA